MFRKENEFKRPDPRRGIRTETVGSRLRKKIVELGKSPTQTKLDRLTEDFFVPEDQEGGNETTSGESKETPNPTHKK